MIMNEVTEIEMNEYGTIATVNGVAYKVTNTRLDDFWYSGHCNPRRLRRIYSDDEGQRGQIPSVAVKIVEGDECKKINW